LPIEVEELLDEEEKLPKPVYYLKEHFEKNKEKAFSAEELIKEHDVSRGTIYRHIKVLVDFGLVKRKQKGRTVYYYWSEKDE
jgi:predicted transcriptional regulator